MQGKKKYTPKIFYQLSLDALVPEDNFYRKVQVELPLDFLYRATRNCYGKEGQQSIDPVVFFKILLVGYLNNINSDRALLRFCSNSLDVRLFLGYDLDEELPWHSTLPVLGTLINHHNMKRINSRGMAQANKHVLMAALTYNLKKYLKFTTRKVHRKAQIMNVPKGKFWFWKNFFPTTPISFI